jgi:hypothetical protein
VSHPSLGLPPPDPTAGHPEAAARLRAERASLAARALEIALDRTPRMRDLHDDYAIRELLRDASALVDRIATSLAADDAGSFGVFSDQAAPLYRRRRIPMDSVIAILEGIRAATPRVLSSEEQVAADCVIDAGISQLREARKLAGDARPRNPILQALYKGG